MSRRTETWLALVVLGFGVIVAGILGLFGYMNATAPLLHPDANAVPSVARGEPPRKWTAAVRQARDVGREATASQNLPGLSIAVGTGGEIVWAEGFGYTNLDTRATVTPDTRFRIGEVSIPLTSAAAGLLLEKHALDLDDEIQTYVPEFPRKQWPVTIGELMAHTAGIRNDAGDEEPMQERCEQTVDGLRRFAKDKLLFEPGTRFRPSSYGWILVSAAIEAAAHERFFDFMRARILEPLGMADTLPDIAGDAIPDRPTFYFPRFAGNNRYGPELAREGDHACFAGAGAYLSTPSDLVRFGMAIDGGRLLQPSTVALLQTPQRLTTGAETGYGLGWTIETVQLAGHQTRMAGHGTKRDFIGGTASLLTFPDRHLVVAVTTNISFADTKAIGLKVAEAFATPRS